MDWRDRTWRGGEEPHPDDMQESPKGLGEADSPATNDSSRRMSLRELTDAAGVSIRTVRYYIAEGLLPPPEGSGPSSAYSQAHLDRLRLIHRLKEAYLPLKEIRRRLSGLEEDGVRAMLVEDHLDPGSAAGVASTLDPTMQGAREYLTMMESGQTYHTEPLGLALPSAPSPLMSQQVKRRPTPEIPPAASAAKPAKTEATTLWRRVRLGDGAELVISDEAYAKHPDRVDWLVRWARKVFD
jgi:DNA-binding transcriptional MerR regulator